MYKINAYKEKKYFFKNKKQPKAQHGAKGTEIRETIKAPEWERDEVKGRARLFLHL